MQRVYLNRSYRTVDAIVRAAFPGYNGRRIEAVIADRTRVSGTMWDEGHRRSYTLVRLADLQQVPLPREQFMVRSNWHEQEHRIEPGFVVVVHCQGRCEHVEIIGPAENVSKMLPAPLELTEDERIVLIATRSLKSSYNGMSNYRFHEARRLRGITAERWAAAKASLVGKRLLNRAGAITDEGRNAVGMFERL